MTNLFRSGFNRQTFQAYWQLMRFHKPAGMWLLWFPVVWALWLAFDGVPPLGILVLFFSGTVIMRAAGCVINDIADYKIDCHVERTAKRPITSGKISRKQAVLTLFVLLGISLIIVLQLPLACFWYALPALAIVFIYPFCKRFIHVPQAVLGLAFSMGIPMAFAAANQGFPPLAAGLMLINFIWVVAYDTVYAMADKADDLKIGVKSSAIFFGHYDRLVVGLMYMAVQLLWLVLAVYKHFSPAFYAIGLVASIPLFYQVKMTASRQSADCFNAFCLNRYYGALMWLALILA